MCLYHKRYPVVDYIKIYFQIKKCLLESTFGLRICSGFALGLFCFPVWLRSALYIVPHRGTPGLLRYSRPGQHPRELVLGRYHQMMLLKIPGGWRKEEHLHAAEQGPPRRNCPGYRVQRQTVLGNAAVTGVRHGGGAALHRVTLTHGFLEQ